MSDIQSPEAEQTRKHLIKLFQSVRNNAYSDMAPILLYRGNDKARHWKEFVDLNIEDDRNYTERIAKRIKRYQDESEGYVFSEYMTEEDKEGFWYVWEILFKMGPDQRRCYFRFKKIGNSLGLADIDS
jgi:hypothetical protein